MSAHLPDWVQLPPRVPIDVAATSWDHDRFREAIGRTWRRVARSYVGRIVIQEIGWSGRTLRIYPEQSWNDEPAAVVNPAHPPNGWRRGVNGGFYGIGTGQPDDAVLEFTPFKATQHGGGTPAATAFADEVLMHELVHVLRCTYGRLDPTPCGYGFDTVDEFYAATVSNMYASEVGGRALQEGHIQGLARRHRRWSGPGRSARIEWEVAMLRRWRRQMPSVTWRLTRVPRTICEFNPFRIYARYDANWHPYGERVPPAHE